MNKSYFFTVTGTMTVLMIWICKDPLEIQTVACAHSSGCDEALINKRLKNR